LGEVSPQNPETGREAGKDKGERASAGDFESPAKVHPGELLQLAPRLADHVRQAYPDWADIVGAAASGLRHELGVS
jgi:hypothetical protein